MLEEVKNIVEVVRADNEIRFLFNGAKGADYHAGYVFFGREFVMGAGPADFTCEYGYSYPFNMVAFYNETQAVLVIIDEPDFKSIHLHKDHMVCYCDFRFSTSAEKVQFQLKSFPADKHFLTDMIKEYRAWFTEKFGSLPESCRDLSGCFNVKRYFFNRSEKFFGTYYEAPGAVFDGGKIRLKELIEEDYAQLGGVDAALLFDYAFKDGIRCGNREPFPFENLKLAELNNMMADIRKEHKIGFWAYFDPCFIEYGSYWDRKFRKSLALHTDNDQPASIWGENVWNPDLGSEAWQEECGDYLQDVINGLNVEGIYLDEIGNGTQFKGQIQGKAYDQINAESRFVDHMQRRINTKKWMCEYPPVAKEAVKFNIVLSDTRTLVNIYRFIFPRLKFVRVINCDIPIGNNTEELNKALFNGEGIWLDHDVNDRQWYPDKLKRTIREHTQFKKKYAAYLESSDAEHYWNNKEGVAVNRYGFSGRDLYIAINENCKPVRFELHIERADKARVVLGGDCFFEQFGNKATFQIPSHSVCAVVN